MPRDKKLFIDCARAKITQILKRASPPLDNLTPQQRKAISELKSCDDIIILEADQGNCTVVINKSDYTTKMMAFLNAKIQSSYKKPSTSYQKASQFFYLEIKVGRKNILLQLQKPSKL